MKKLTPVIAACSYIYNCAVNSSLCFTYSSENGYASTDEDASEFSQASEGGYEYTLTVHSQMIIMK